MPNSIPASRKQHADEHVMIYVVFILVMTFLAAILAETYPGGAFDLVSPTNLMQGWAPRNR
jgi:hypothetical protein